MNSLEWVSMWCVFAFQTAGTIIFSLKIDTGIMSPELFGYHELFHCLSLFAAFFVYQVNYSIVSRYNINGNVDCNIDGNGNIDDICNIIPIL